MKRLQAVPDDPASSSADQFTGSTAAMMMMMTVLQQQQQHLDSATRYDSGIASFDDDCLLQQISKLSTGNDFNDTLDTSNDQGSTEYYHSNVAPQQSYINRTALSSNCVDDQNEDGDTLLHLALIHDKPFNVIRTIVKIACDKNDVDYLNLQNRKYYQTALHLAVLFNRPDVAELLVSTGARVDLLDSRGQTPFHVAAQRGRIQCLVAMAHRGQRDRISRIVNSLDYAGNSCLHLALKSRNFRMLRQLVHDCAADINTCDGLRGATVLHLAVYNNDIEMANYILEQPSTVIDQLTWDGRTSLDVAISHKEVAMESLLRHALAHTNYESTSDSESDSEQMDLD